MAHSLQLLNSSNRDSGATSDRHLSLAKWLAQQGGGVLLVGHGTRKVAGQQEFLQLVRWVQEELPEAVVEGAFLELARPDIPAGVEEIVRRGCRSVVVVPVLLFEAGHAKTDIPEAVLESLRGGELKWLGQTSPLDTHPSVLALSERRFEEALVTEPKVLIREVDSKSTGLGEISSEDGGKGQSKESAEGRGGIEDIDFSLIALAMVGRGTSDSRARGRMQELTRLRALKTPVGWSETGFFAGGEVDVDTLLERSAQSGCRTVVVQPHLLFEGELMEQLREKVQRKREEGNGQEWRLAEPLGAERALARVFIELLDEFWRMR